MAFVTDIHVTTMQEPDVGYVIFYCVLFSTACKLFPFAIWQFVTILTVGTYLTVGTFIKRWLYLLIVMSLLKFIV